MSEIQFNLPAGVERLEAPARLALELMLIGFLAMVLARLAWLLIAPVPAVAGLDERPLPVPIGTQTSGAAVQADRSLLVRSNPFYSEAPEVIPDAPETSLNLKLSGLRMTIEGPGGSAIIVTPNGQGKSYIVGDEILSGVVLEHIRSDRVIITRNGVQETLMLSGRGEGLSVIGEGSQTQPADSVADPAPGFETFEGRVEDPGALFQLFGVSPLQEGGRTYAYRLAARGSTDAVAATGLQDGDVLTAIEGAPVGRLSMGQLVEKIGEARSVNLSIERNGTLSTVRLRYDE